MTTPNKQRPGVPLPYLVKWRRWRVMTQQELADNAGVVKTTIARIESGKQGAAVKSIDKIARALNITREQLVRQEPSDDLKARGVGD